jgi:hypothetical protein
MRSYAARLFRRTQRPSRPASNSKSDYEPSAAAARPSCRSGILHNSEHCEFMSLRRWQPDCTSLRTLATAPLTDEVHERESVERLVLRYLLRHPAAADSAEGVRLWWLRDAGEVSQAMLMAALEELLERGWLVTRGETPEMRIYSLNEGEREAVARFAAEPGDRY